MINHKKDAAPEDKHLRLTLDEIGTLDEFAFTHPGLRLNHSFSVSFWFFAQSLNGTQVLLNQGDDSEEASGWSVFLEEQRLFYRVRWSGGPTLSLSAVVGDVGRWHHVVGVLDLAERRQLLYLDGQAVVRCEMHPDQPAQPLFPETPPELRVGGYTDPAGGHFDHTFGRNGTGWIDDIRLFTRSLTPEEVEQFVDRDNQPPHADFDARPTSGDAPLTVSFDAGASHDPDGAIRHFFWTFGDGTSGRGRSLRHHYPYAGRYRVRLTVVDDDFAPAQMEKELSFSGQANPLHIRPVFVNGEEGHACYRIPAIIRTANGDLIAFAEGRVASCSDSTEAIRLVAKRSRDNGETWDELQILARHVVDGKEHAIQNISPVVDTVEGTGRIAVVYNKMEHNEWEVARGTGMNRVACILSDDHGVTWQDERDITLQVHRPYNPDYQHVYPDAALPSNRKADWRIVRPALGHAIQLTQHPFIKGRFLFAGTLTQGDTSVFDSYNYLFWSDDLGESWQIGGVIEGLRANGASAQGLNEATAVELENGNVMINSRNYQNRKPVHRRAVTLASFDEKGEVSFQPTYHDEALLSSGVQASIIRYTHSTQARYGSKSRILFVNPAHPQARYNLTLRLSYDEGRTWPVSRVLDPGPAAYSDLVIQNDMRIGVLYERGNHGGIYYVNCSLEWLTRRGDALGPHGSKP